MLPNISPALQAPSAIDGQGTVLPEQSPASCSQGTPARLLCLYHKGGMGRMSEIEDEQLLMLANCCFLGRISNMTTNVFVFRNLSRLSPELTTMFVQVSGNGAFALCKQWLLTEHCRCHGMCTQASS